MKGLRKVLTPFAPDQSGAVGVLYELGGLVVICDAGGCTGNICGFDEPRWSTRRSAVFSAGLRDMDAIMGRDDRLVEKLCDAARKLQPRFAAVIGTPVPSVIGTDYRALMRMAAKKCELPMLAVDTNGMELHDAGASKAYVRLIETFAEPRADRACDAVGVFGTTPLDLSDLHAAEKITAALGQNGAEDIRCYGMGAGLEALREAANVKENLVTAPSGLAAARLLREKYGIPYTADVPYAGEYIPAQDYTGLRVLVCAQQVLAHALRTRLQRLGAAGVTAAVWFMQDRELSREGDVQLHEEDDFAALAGRGFDVIFADSTLRPLVPDFGGLWVDVPDFALSGRLVNADA